MLLDSLETPKILLVVPGLFQLQMPLDDLVKNEDALIQCAVLMKCRMIKGVVVLPCRCMCTSMHAEMIISTRLSACMLTLQEKDEEYALFFVLQHHVIFQEDFFLPLLGTRQNKGHY